MKNCLIPIIVLTLFLSACASKGDRKGRERPERPASFGGNEADPLSERRRQRQLAQLDAREFYLRARSQLDRSDFSSAIEAYDDLNKRYPFSDYATQGELERLYALYRNFQPQSALSGADRFLREHPRHPAIDYIYYLKGLVNFEREGENLSVLPIDETKSDISSQRRSFDDFALLIQRFPGSRFAGDAHQRMVYVRNRAAAHELHVVDYYVRRGAYIAAAKRAEQIIAQYPGTLAGYKALAALVMCYEKGGLEDQAKDSRRLLDAQDQKLVRKALATPISKLGDSDYEYIPGSESADTGSGFFGSIANFFSPADTSDKGIEIVLPSLKSDEKAAKDPAKSNAMKDIEAQAANSANTKASEPYTESAPPDLKRIEVFFEPYDEAESAAEKQAEPQQESN